MNHYFWLGMAVAFVGITILALVIATVVLIVKYRTLYAGLYNVTHVECPHIHTRINESISELHNKIADNVAELNREIEKSEGKCKSYTDSRFDKGLPAGTK